MNSSSFQQNNVWRFVVAMCFILATTMHGQYAGPTVSLPARASNVSLIDSGQVPSDLQLTAGDVIQIQVAGAPELVIGQSHLANVGSGGGSVQSGDGFTVSQQGSISLPFLGIVKVEGLTTLEVAESLRTRWREKGILTDPQVVVSLVASPSRYVTVLGEVMHPAGISTITPIRLLDAIAACGGLTNFASHALVIHRKGVENPTTVELGVDPAKAVQADMALIPGDKLIIPRIGSIYILGAVKNTLAVPAQSDHAITVLRAVTLAGGLKFSAKSHSAKIIRVTENNQRTELPVDFRAILSGKQKDIALASEDILYFPTSAAKAVLTEGGIGIATSVLYGSMYALSTVR